MFRLRLHPTPAAFVLGIGFIALWALLWVWFITQLAAAPRAQIRAETETGAPELTVLEASTNPAA
jgi:hypothetical protein